MTPEKPAFPPGLKFSELECLLYVACQLGRRRPQFYGGFLAEQEREAEDVLDGLARLKLIRPRLQYLGQVANEYAQSIAGALAQNGQSEESKAKIFAHRVSSSRVTIIDVMPFVGLFSLFFSFLLITLGTPICWPLMPNEMN